MTFEEVIQLLPPSANKDALLVENNQRSKWIERASAKNFKDILASLPHIEKVSHHFSPNQIAIGTEDEITQDQLITLKSALEELKTWRKGPIDLFGIHMDMEWRSDFKWQRLLPKLESLENKTILDIGTNNGYFLFQMAAHKPKLALGIDPVLFYNTQFKLLNHFAKIPNIHHSLLGVEHIIHMEKSFDVIFSMGILYHHRNPMLQLEQILGALKPGGTFYLETIGIAGEEPICFFPPERYAKMKNVWFLPTCNALMNMLSRAHFKQVEVISTKWEGEHEQRTTSWCVDGHESYASYLTENKKTTIEGHPLPQRFLIKCKRSN